tara:strand:+ start:27497 stop:27769 length:273 start_codon:yes stop_codon:yes gene_type:complete
MPSIEDHSYLKICAELASCLSISLSSARRKVELAVAKEGKKGLDERKSMAKNLLKSALLDCKNNKAQGANSQLDELLQALAQDENFMIED